MIAILLTCLAVLDARSAAVEPHRDRHGNRFHVVRVDLTTDIVEMGLNDPSGRRLASLGALIDLYERRHQEPWFATNGGMFTPAHQPVGLYVEDGRELHPLDRAPGSGNFFMLPNGVFAVSLRRAWVLATDAFARLPAAVRSSITYATQSGPMLVVDGRPHRAFRADSSHRAIRSGVGQISPTTLVFAISESPVTFMELSDLFRLDYGCSRALYLDGAISLAWIPGLHHRDTGGDFGVMIAVRRAAGP